MEQFRHRPDGVAERQAFAAPEKQSLLDITLEREHKPCIDAELADAGDAVAQAAYREAVETRHAAVRVSLGVGLECFLAPQIVFQPGCQHGAGGQASDAHEGDDVFRSRLRQYLLEVLVRIAFFGDGKRCADLHRSRAQLNQVAHFIVTIDAAGGNQWNTLALYTQVFEYIEYFCHCGFEVKARAINIFSTRRAQMAAGIARVFDHDRVRQTILAHPFFQYDVCAARIRQDGDQRHVGKIPRHVGQLERQARAHHNGVRAALACLAHICGMRIHRLHYVNRNRATPSRQRECAADLAIQCDEIGLIERGLVAAAVRRSEQIGVMMAQIDAGYRAHRAKFRDRAGQPVRRDADTHAALDDRQ